MPAKEVTTISVERSIVSSANTIFMIDCLGEGDKQSARSRHEEVCDTLMGLSPQSFTHDTSRVYHERCKHRSDWATAMDKIRDMSKQGLLPLVFIDGHGDPQKGLQMPDGGFISWAEYGRDLKAITYAARGELTVVAAFCHSYAFVGSIVKLEEKLPFAFYFGYEDAVQTATVDHETGIICDSLLRDGGQSLDFDKLQISRYDEYDHAIKHISPIVMMRLAPKTLVSIIPQLSKAQLRARLERDLAQQGQPLGKLRKAIKEAMRNTNRLAVRLIEVSMHDTERRRRFIRKILSEVKKYSGAA